MDIGSLTDIAGGMENLGEALKGVAAEEVVFSNRMQDPNQKGGKSESDKQEEVKKTAKLAAEREHTRQKMMSDNQGGSNDLSINTIRNNSIEANSANLVNTGVIRDAPVSSLKQGAGAKEGLEKLYAEQQSFEPPKQQVADPINAEPEVEAEVAKKHEAELQSSKTMQKSEAIKLQEQQAQEAGVKTQKKYPRPTPQEKSPKPAPVPDRFASQSSERQEEKPEEEVESKQLLLARFLKTMQDPKRKPQEKFSKEELQTIKKATEEGSNSLSDRQAILLGTVDFNKRALQADQQSSHTKKVELGVSNKAELSNSNKTSIHSSPTHTQDTSSVVGKTASLDKTPSSTPDRTESASRFPRPSPFNKTGWQ